jgi:hypothetical protein
MEVGPVDPPVLRRDLEAEVEGGIPLARLLSTLVDEVSLEEADGGHHLRLEKRAPLTRPEAREPV